MPVKKIGSKLTQGVRQIKAQQVTAPVVAEEPRVPSTAVPAPSAPSDAKPAAAEVGSPGTLHPSRVWPD